LNTTDLVHFRFVSYFSNGFIYAKGISLILAQLRITAPVG